MFNALQSPFEHFECAAGITKYKEILEFNHENITARNQLK